jgi:gliding motility-associated-like protein
MFTTPFKLTFMNHSYFKNYLRFMALAVVLFLGYSRASAQSCSLVKNPNDGRACLGDPAGFTVTVTGGCTITTYDWDFGNGSTQTTSVPSATCIYTAVDTTGFCVKVTVHCTNGNSFTCSLNGLNGCKVKVFPPPIVKFKTTSFKVQCETGNLFTIDDSSYSPSGAKIIFRRILWGDGSSDQVSGNPAAPLSNKTHSYSTYTPGDPNNGKPHHYNWDYEIRDEYGCVTKYTATDYVIVGGRLDISFNSAYTIHCDSTPVTFTNTSTDIINAYNSRPGLLKQFVWNFGDGTSYTSPTFPGVNDPFWITFSHQYRNKMGPFDVSLTVTDSMGCSYTYLKKKGADNIYIKPDFQVSHTGIFSDSDSSCFKGNNFTFKVPQPIHPIYIFKSSYNFGDPNSGIENFWPQKAGDPVLWQRDHAFSGCGVYLATVTVTAYMPNGTTKICDKTATAYVKVWGPSATMQSPAKGVCVLNRYQCHIKDTVYFTNLSKYCQGDSALKKADGVTDSILFPMTVSHPTVLRVWDFGDLISSLPCISYSDPITNPAKFGYRIQDTINVGKNCNYSMDSLPKHWYTPGKEMCYTVKLQLYDLKTGCGDTDILSLALQPPVAKLASGVALDLQFEGQKCLSDGNDGRKVKLSWQQSDPKCANQFVWLNFDSACGVNNFTPQTAFQIPPWGGPPPFAYGCTYLGSPESAGGTVHFSQEGHTFQKKYTKQYTSTCDPKGKVTIGLVVQNGCDSAVVTFQDSLWVYWTGCDWGFCPFSTLAQKNVCRAANPNTPTYPAYARLDDAYKINFFNAAQKAAAKALMPLGQVVCFACRDTFWYHNAIEYKDLAATQDPNIAIKPKYCVWDYETYCPSVAASSQQFMMAATWTAYVYVPGKPNFRSVASDTQYTYTDTIYQTPVYKRLHWSVLQYISNGNYIADTTGPIDVTLDYPRNISIDTSYCFKNIGGNLVKVIQSIDTFIRDSIRCQTFRFTSNGKWVVNLDVTNTDTCDKANEGTRLVIVGNKIDFGINDTTFCLGEAVKPIINIRYWWNKPSPPNTQYDPYDYWNDIGRNPKNGGLNNREVYFINWGDGGTYIKFDTAIRTIREHSYNAPGNYTIKIMWKDSDGCFDTLVLKYLVHVVKPHAAFYIPQANIACDQIIQFKDSSWIQQDTSLGAKYDQIIGWNWDFGDGAIHSALQNPAHLYSYNGDYTIKLRIFTAQGCQDSITKSIHISGPVPDFELIGADTGCIPFEVFLRIKNFSDTTYRTMQVRWGDKKDTLLTKPTKSGTFTLSPANTLRHIYTAPGQYCINVDAVDTVYDDLGNANVCKRSFPCDTCGNVCVVVLDFALAEFTAPDTVCVNDPITVTATKDTSIYTIYTWDFGDSLPIQTVNKPIYSVTHTYYKPGTYNILFTPKDYLCANTFSKKIVVLTTMANFDVVDSSQKPLFKFANRSTGTNAKTKYLWDFGDGKTSTDQNPEHTYALLDTGCHIVKLHIDLACPRDTFKTVCNSYFFQVIVPNVFTVNGDGINDVFDIYIVGQSYYDLAIYNRWGEKVFSSTVASLNWNGLVNNTGAPAPAGEYYYTFKYKTKAEPDKIITTKGILTLIRK